MGAAKHEFEKKAQRVAGRLEGSLRVGRLDDDATKRAIALLEVAAGEAQQVRATNAALLEALRDFLEAQDALDNRETAGPNAGCHFKLMARRNRSREVLDAAIAIS